MFIVYPDYLFNLFSVSLSAFKQKVLPEWYLGPYQKTMVPEVAIKPSDSNFSSTYRRIRSSLILIKEER